MVTGGECAQVRLELGAYLLGAIEPAQRALVDRHLAGCPRCRAELSDLAALPSLLRRVPPDQVQQLVSDDTVGVTSGPPLSALVHRVAVVRRRRWILTIAAAVIAGAATASAVLALRAAPPPAASAPAWAVAVQGTNSATGAWAAIRYTPEPWGTKLEVSVTGIAAGTRCQLTVTGPGGHEVAAGGWDIVTSQQPAWYQASVPFRAASLRSFEITVGRKVLVKISAR